MNREPLTDAELDELEALRAENAELTKALTGLTCGGSEFFIRKGERYVADIKACVEWVQRRDRVAHERVIAAIRDRNEAQAVLAESKPINPYRQEL